MNCAFCQDDGEHCAVCDEDKPTSDNAVDLLTQVEGVGETRARALLERFETHGAVCRAATSYWAAVAEVPGFTEERAKTLFDRLRDAGVYEKWSDATAPEVGA